MLGQQIFAQEYPIKSDLKSKSQNTMAYEILEEIEIGISKTELSSISPYLSSESPVIIVLTSHSMYWKNSLMNIRSFHLSLIALTLTQLRLLRKELIIMNTKVIGPKQRFILL
jgi:hypothetical protein